MTHPRFPTDRHGWRELLPERTPRPALSGTHRTRWAVIGAGFTGLAAARRLAELHPEAVLLIEAREVGQGASGRNSGFAVHASHFPGAFSEATLDDNRRVNRLNEEGLDLLRGRVTAAGIDCAWDEGGFHHAAAEPASAREAENFHRYLQELDIPHTVLDAEAMHERLGTGHYRCGIHVHAGALVQPAALVHGLAATLPANTVLFENSPVLDIEPGRPVRLVLPDGEVHAEGVLIAANNEVAKLGFLRGRVTASTLSGSFTRQLTGEELANLGSLEQWGVLSLHGGGATVRLTADRRISLRNTAEYNGAALLTEAELARRQEIHRASFTARFPQLSHVPFEFGWSGVEGISRNQTNFFGRQADNVWFAGGYNGSGVSRGTAFGHALAEHASGGQSALIADCLASKPATWIPPRPFVDIGAAWTVRKRFRGVGRDR
jgi:glycine/D-amino acid oxidase-like deaminating enzyme